MSNYKRKFYSAQHDEIQNGETTDIYFLRTLDLLKHLNLQDSKAVADIFPLRDGIMCGVEEVLSLFDGKDVEIKGLNDGEEFQKKEVILQIKGKYKNYAIYETVVLGILASNCGWATAAREIKQAAGNKMVICFGSRHIHPAVSPAMEKSALIGGVDGVSNVLAAKISNIKPMGTIPHAAIIITGDTVKVARAFDEIMDETVPRIILVDTFLDEAEESLRVAKALKGKLTAVRLDTPSERGGVTPELVREVRARLDLEGFNNVKIVVSGGLYPEKIRELSNAGADIFGVGSYISCARPIEMTMDLKEVNGIPIAKRGRIPGASKNPRLKKLYP